MLNNLHRCWWCGDDPLYMHYHDTEWGRPVIDDTRLFEKICLEGFQAGLSWITILRKRENFRIAFDSFDIDKVANFKNTDIQKMLKNEGIIRHEGKIKSTINNAMRAKELIAEYGSLATYFWKWEPHSRERPKKFDSDSIKKMAISETSTALSKDLKKRGWSFVGPTTIYAFMQAMGMVNDHVDLCHCRGEIEKIRVSFVPPQ